MPAQQHGVVAAEPRRQQDGDRSLQRRPAAGSPRRGPCCRCAARWSRRCCPSRCGGCRRGRPRGSAAGRTGSSRAGSRERRSAGSAGIIRTPAARPSRCPAPRPPARGRRTACSAPCRAAGRPPPARRARDGTGRDRPAAPLASRPASTPSSAAGRAVSSSIACAKRQRAAVDLGQRHAEQGGEPGAPGRGLGERLALVVGVARLVVGGDRVDRAVGQRGDHRQPVGLLAQRRRQLGVGAEVADRRLVEVEIGRRRVAGDGEAVGLRPADQRAAPRRWRRGRNAPPRRSARASRMSRATRIASAAAGMPGRPSRVASSPSVAAPPAASDGSSGCCTMRPPKPRA